MDEETSVPNSKMNKFSLKKENEDNLIENDSKEESSKNTDLLSSKYKIKYTKLLKLCRIRDKPEFHYENEFYCNLLLMPSVIDISDKLSTLSMISYCYQERENCNLIYLINHKFEKNIQYIDNVDPNYFLNGFCRAAYFLQIQKNVIYAFKYILKCLDLINKYSNLEKKKKIINNYLNSMKEDLIKYIKSKEDQFKEKEIVY